MPVREVWVTETVRALQAAGSWTGRIHIHKTLFLAQALKLTSDVPFQFEMYHYGRIRTISTRTVRKKRTSSRECGN